MQPMFKHTGLSAYLDSFEITRNHRLFKQIIVTKDLLLVDQLELGDSCLVNLKESGKTIVIERVA